jgi:hypothetical protein
MAGASGLPYFPPSARTALSACQTNTRLALRQADQAGTDFALIETELETLYAQLAQVSKRADLIRATLGLTIDTAVLTRPCVWAMIG